MTGQEGAEADAPPPEVDTADGATAANTDPARETELQAWLTLGTQAAAMLDRLATLVRLELSLALADGKRLILVALAMIPLVLLAWVGFSALIGWLVYAGTSSVGLGLLGFLLLQLAIVGLLLQAARRLSRSLGLPASRRQLQAILQAADCGQGQEQQHPT